MRHPACPHFLPTTLVSEWPPQPFLLPGPAPGSPCPRNQVSPSSVSRRAQPCPSLHSGFQCISYPRSGPKSRALEPRAALESAGANSPLPEGDPCDLPRKWG